MSVKFNMKSHEPIKGDGGSLVGYRVKPYIRLSHGDSPPVFVQNGKFFGAGGKELEDVPSWVQDSLGKLNAVTLESIGLKHSPQPKKTSKAA